MSDDPKYPDVTVQLSGEDGNAFFIISRVRRALRRAGYGVDVQDAFSREAKSGTYNHLLATCDAFVNVQ